jgi:hypothetical protein
MPTRMVIYKEKLQKQGKKRINNETNKESWKEKLDPVDLQWTDMPSKISLSACIKGL